MESPIHKFPFTSQQDKKLLVKLVSGTLLFKVLFKLIEKYSWAFPFFEMLRISITFLYAGNHNSYVISSENQTFYYIGKYYRETYLHCQYFP